MSVNFDGKDIKRIEAITLPDGRPGFCVTYTERSEASAASPVRKLGISIPWLKSEAKDSTAAKAPSDSRPWRRCLINGALIGFVIVAIYLALRAL